MFVRSKAAALLVAAIILISALFPVNALMAEETGMQFDMGSAKACLLVDAYSGRVVVSENASEKLPVAALTRLGALLVACEGFDRGEIEKNTPVSVDEKASKIGGTTAFLRSGEIMNAEGMLLAAAMINAGDATHALCSALCGGETAAVARVNSRLCELGVEANYTDICGSGEKLSALELASIASALIKSPVYSQYGTKYYEKLAHDGAGETELANPNKLIKQYSGCLGVGTGSSKEALYCGAFAAKRGETCFIAVVIGAESGAERFTLARDLLDYGFASYRSVKIKSAGESVGSVRVRGSLVREIEAETGADATLLLKTSGSEYTLETELCEETAAPIEKGDALGRLIVRAKDGTVLSEIPLVAASSAPETGFIDCFRHIINVFLKRG